MPHNHNLIPALDKLPKSVSLHPGLHPGCFLYLLSLASEIGDVLPFLRNDLIAAPCQRQIYGNPCKIIIFRKTNPAQAQAYTEGHSHFIANVHGLYILQ